MKQILLIKLIVLSLIVTLGCSKSEVKDIAHDKRSDSQSQSTSMKSDSFVVKDYSGSSQKNNSGKIIPPDKLLDFFPDKINGAEKLPPGYGFQNWQSHQFSSASCDYTFSRGGMTIIIQDFGGSKFIPDYELVDFNDNTIESRINAEKITVPHGKGYFQWEPNHRMGIISVLVEDRFIVKIDAAKLPENSLSLTDYFNLIKIDNMVKFAQSIK